MSAVSQTSKMRLDKTITISIILTLIIQTSSALMWVGAAEARLAVLEARSERALPASERLARLEEQMVMARQSLSRIERRLDAQALQQSRNP